MAQIIRAVVATTHIDKQNMKITREALEHAAESINNGDKPLFGTDHDVTLPPKGKVISATVEMREDGEYQLITETEVFEKIEELSLGDGIILLKQESEIDKSPFNERYEKQKTNDYEISFDVVNFEDYNDAKQMFNEIRSESNVEFETSIFGRKAAVPDPEIIIKLSQTIVGYLLAKDIVKKFAEKVVEKSGDVFAEDLAKFYSFLKITIIKYVKYAHPKSRPVTYIFVVPTNPLIEFVARTSDPNTVISALVLERLEPAIEHAEHFGQVLNATKLQYLLNDNGEWEFNYLLTSTGGIIGTEKAFSNRSQKVKMMIDIANKKKGKKSRKKNKS